MIITLPWPPKEASPNSRCHWAKKSKAVRTYRQICRLHIIEQARYDWDVWNEVRAANGKLHLVIDFFPPDRRRRDDDNVSASFKGARDGICRVSWRRRQPVYISHPCLQDEVRKSGEVVVTITTIDQRKV